MRYNTVGVRPLLYIIYIPWLCIIYTYHGCISCVYTMAVYHMYIPLLLHSLGKPSYISQQHALNIAIIAWYQRAMPVFYLCTSFLSFPQMVCSFRIQKCQHFGGFFVLLTVSKHWAFKVQMQKFNYYNIEIVEEFNSQLLIVKK